MLVKSTNFDVVLHDSAMEAYLPVILYRSLLSEHLARRSRSLVFVAGVLSFHTSRVSRSKRTCCSLSYFSILQWQLERCGRDRHSEGRREGEGGTEGVVLAEREQVSGPA
jgi:hypothetical protein